MPCLMRKLEILILFVSRLCPIASVPFGAAFISSPSLRAVTGLRMTHEGSSTCKEGPHDAWGSVRMDAHDNVNVRPKRRGEFLFGATKSFATVAAVVTAAGSSFGAPADAYVKGNTPPSNYNKRKGKGEGGETAVEREPPERVTGDDPVTATFSVTNSGVRYKDLKIGTGPEVKPNNVVGIRYRVEKLGKRSYDGISGETQSVFSLGYGEDDDKAGDVLTVPLGAGRLVSAVDEGVIGMNIGGVRRVAVRPERGWKKQDPKCATEIDMGALSGVPGAAVSKVEDCIDLTLEPRPVGYGASRRMARRFDETLIVEVEMVNAKEAGGRIF